MIPKQGNATAGRGFSRRKFVTGAALAGAATMAAISLTGCGDSDEKKVTGEPQVVDDTKIVSVIDEYESVDVALAQTSSWNLPLGTIPFHCEGYWAALMMTPESARVVNTLGIMSLAMGTPVTLVESPTQGGSYGFFDVRCSEEAYAWIEMDYAAQKWVLIGQGLENGQFSGDPVKLDSGDSDWDPPRFTVAGSSVIWLKMPALAGSKTSESSHCYRWSVGDEKGADLYESIGRFATPPRVSDGILTIAPRVNNDDGVYYGIMALNLENNQMVDQLVMPQSVSPFEAVYMGDSFAFSVEANYSSGGSLGNMGTFIGREGGPFVFLSREPLAGVAGKGSTYLVKAQSSHFVIDTQAQTYAVLPAPDKTLEYGDYPASEGATDLFVTYATVRGDSGLPESVNIRVFSL